MFLIALREPLRTTVVVVDFTGKTLDDIIDRVLRLDSAQTSHSMSMTALQRALPTEEETQNQYQQQPTITSHGCRNDLAFVFVWLFTSSIQRGRKHFYISRSPRLYITTTLILLLEGG